MSISLQLGKTVRTLGLKQLRQKILTDGVHIRTFKHKEGGFLRQFLYKESFYYFTGPTLSQCTTFLINDPLLQEYTCWAEIPKRSPKPEDPSYLRFKRQQMT